MHEDNDSDVTVYGVMLTKEEYRTYRYEIWLEALGTPVAIGVYVLLAMTTVRKDAEIPSERTLAMAILQLVLALVSFLMLFSGFFRWPQKEDNTYHAKRYLGRWLFLTRHCIIYQVSHLSLSFIGTVFEIAFIQRLVYGSTLWVGALGFFVTIQFFLLVWNNPKFVETCDKMEAAGHRCFCGLISFRGYDALIHIPPICLSICDVTLVKQHDILASACSLRTTCVFVLAYCAFYVVFVKLNFAVTGHYPYALLEKFDSVSKWIGLTAGQAATVLVFVMCNYGLSLVPQPWLSS